MWSRSGKLSELLLPLINPSRSNSDLETPSLESHNWVYLRSEMWNHTGFDISIICLQQINQFRGTWNMVKNRWNEHDEETRGNKIMTITITMMNKDQQWRRSRQFGSGQNWCRRWSRKCSAPWNSTSKMINRQLMVRDLYKDSTTLEMYYLMCSSDQLLAHVLGRPASWRLVFLWQ